MPFPRPEIQSATSVGSGSGGNFVSFLTGGINPLVQAATPLLLLAGRLRVEVDRLPLDQVAEAWRRLAAGSHAKIVLVP